MKEYFISVITVALVSGSVATLMPNSGLSKHIKLLCALCTVACIAFPIARLLGGSLDTAGLENTFDVLVDSDEKYDEIYNRSISRYSELNAEFALKSEIVQNLDIANDAFDVKIVREEKDGSIYVSRVRIYLYPNALSIDPRLLENYIFDRLKCNCEFVYKDL